MENSEEKQNIGRCADILKKLSTKEKVELLRELKMDEKIVAIFNAEEKIINDRVTGEAIAAEKGRAKGMAEALLEAGWSFQQVSNKTGLSIEEIKRLNQ